MKVLGVLLLQWGRALLRGKGIEGRLDGRAGLVASMGPRITARKRGHGIGGW